MGAPRLAALHLCTKYQCGYTLGWLGFEIGPAIEDATETKTGQSKNSTNRGTKNEGERIGKSKRNCCHLAHSGTPEEADEECSSELELGGLRITRVENPQ